MPKKNDAPASFETALSELEQIVTRLESGDLPLEEALNEFERGVQLARQWTGKTAAGGTTRANPVVRQRRSAAYAFRTGYRVNGF